LAGLFAESSSSAGMPAARFEARVPAMSLMILPHREGQLKWWLLSYQGFSENSKSGDAENAIFAKTRFLH
jgi:hypothetical protein